MLRRGQQAAGRLLLDAYRRTRCAQSTHSPFRAGALRCSSTTCGDVQTPAEQQLATLIKESFERDPALASRAVAAALTPEQRAALFCDICKAQTEPLLKEKLEGQEYVNKLFDDVDEACPKGLLSRWAGPRASQAAC
jgi:hypothetical protein